MCFTPSPATLAILLLRPVLFVDNARYHHAKLVQAWLARPGCRVKLHFIPTCCPHLDPAERLWGLMRARTPPCAGPCLSSMVVPPRSADRRSRKATRRGISPAAFAAVKERWASAAGRRPLARASRSTAM